MGVLADLTYTHLEVNSTVEGIQKTIEHAREVRHTPEDVYASLVLLVPSAMALRDRLVKYFAYQREHLFPRVCRVFGGDMEELGALDQYHVQIIESLDHFLSELPNDEDSEELSHKPMRIAYLELVFEEFLDLYERHCSLERTFYETYSTILFPGGAMTD
ncbi:MAG: hypothetical protein H0U74_06770 [Bradymonadaceae bacterium]|nr:hypothetical protein [Lujinxingiaceae bacterium]